MATPNPMTPVQMREANVIREKQWKQMTLAYPLVRLDRRADIETLIFDFQHSDRVDFDLFRATLRSTIKKEHLIQFDAYASRMRHFMYRRHSQIRVNSKISDYSISEQLEFGCDVRRNLWYFHEMTNYDKHKPRAKAKLLLLFAEMKKFEEI